MSVLEKKAKTFEEWVNTYYHAEALEAQKDFNNPIHREKLLLLSEVEQKIKEKQIVIDENKLLFIQLNQKYQKSEAKLAALKQKLRDLLKACPLVPTLTMLSVGERSRLLGEHSCQLDEWYQKVKRELQLLEGSVKP